MENVPTKKPMTSSERVAKWRIAHPEKVKEIKRISYERHKDTWNDYKRRDHQAGQIQPQSVPSAA